MVSRKPQPKPKKSATDITYHFNVGVTVDAADGYPQCRYEGDSGPVRQDGDEVRAEELPPHIDLRGLIAIGAVRPVEDVD